MFFNIVDNALAIVGDLLEGEAPSRQRIAQLISDGLSIATIAVMFNVGEDVIRNLISET